MMKLKANSEIIDLGDIKFGEIKEFTYDLTNTSNEDLTIVKLVAGCKSCTFAKIHGKSRILPNENRTLNVTFTPGDLGRTIKGISVLYKTDNQEIPNELKLKFKANINE